MSLDQLSRQEWYKKNIVFGNKYELRSILLFLTLSLTCIQTRACYQIPRRYTDKKITHTQQTIKVIWEKVVVKKVQSSFLN